jgi:hypothetical protein
MALAPASGPNGFPLNTVFVVRIHVGEPLNLDYGRVQIRKRRPGHAKYGTPEDSTARRFRT